MSINYMGPDVREAQKDMELLPLPVLFQYMQNPQNMSADGVAFSLIAATELARRKRLEDAATASQQPDPSRVPTIAEGLMSGQMGDTGGVPTPKTGIAAFAQPAAAPPAAPAPAPVAAAPTPAPAPAPVAMAGPPVRMAHGGIIAFNGEERSDVPKQTTAPIIEDDESLPLAERAKRTLARLRRGSSDIDTSKMSLAERWNRPEGPPISDAAYPETAGMRSLASPTILPPPTPKPAPRPAVAPTPTAPAVPAVPAVPVASTEPDAFAEAMKVLGAPPATLTPEQAEAARKQAQERLSGITDPRMARIAALQAEAEGIGSRRDEGALGRALMQFGLRTIQGGSRPGTAGSAVAGAGLEALSSYEKEQTGMIERALRTNQIKIELEKELMKQGVDRNTAADLAEREARKQVADVEREKGDRAKDRGTLALNKLTADQRAENAQRMLEIRGQMLELQTQLAAARASGNIDKLNLIAERIESTKRAALVSARNLAIDNIQKQIDTNPDLGMRIRKDPGLRQRMVEEQVGFLLGDAAGAGGGGAQKEVSFADAIKSR